MHRSAPELVILRREPEGMDQRSLDAHGRAASVGLRARRSIRVLDELLRRHSDALEVTTTTPAGPRAGGTPAARPPASALTRARRRPRAPRGAVPLIVRLDGSSEGALGSRRLRPRELRGPHAGAATPGAPASPGSPPRCRRRSRPGAPRPRSSRHVSYSTIASAPDRTGDVPEESDEDLELLEGIARHARPQGLAEDRCADRRRSVGGADRPPRASRVACSPISRLIALGS